MIGGIGGRPLKRDLIRTIIEALRQPSLKAALRVALGAGDMSASSIHAATSKGTPVDADELPLLNSAGSFGLVKLTWANLKATLKTYFDTLYQPISSVQGSVPVRQTVLSGPVDTAGLPNFVPASAVGLTLTTQNITASAPLVVSAASGSGVDGDVNTTGQATANFSWSAMGNGVTWYGYVTVSGGALTPAWTGLAPIYQWGGTPSVTSGQLTYNIQEGKMYLGNGTTAPAVNAVVLLAATSSGGNITTVTPYQYLGRYDSGFTATLPTTNTAFSKNHYLGMKPGIIDMVLECTSAEFGYQVGDQIHAASIRTLDGVPNAGNLTLAANLTSVFGHTAATTSFQAQSITTGAFSTLTLASWKWKITASRGW